ncbi:hypothetical protein ABH926_010341 [Catenulispora sp. GP43]
MSTRSAYLNRGPMFSALGGEDVQPLYMSCHKAKTGMTSA